MGSSRKEEKKKGLFLYLYECVYCTVVFIRRINHPLIFLFSSFSSPHFKKRSFALKCSYKGEITVAMFEREREKKY